MREHIIEHNKKLSGAVQILWDDSRVWVNGPDGCSIARWSGLFGLVDIHHPSRHQSSTGETCLSCGSGRTWSQFRQQLGSHYGINLPEDMNSLSPVG